jgi:hypothetical protein
MLKKALVNAAMWAKNRRRIRPQRLAHLRHPRLQMLAEQCHRGRKVSHRHIVPGNQSAHDFEDTIHMVFGVRFDHHLTLVEFVRPFQTRHNQTLVAF